MELTPAEGHTLDEVEEAAEVVLASIATDPPTEEEFERAINRIEMQHYRMLSPRRRVRRSRRCVELLQHLHGATPGT